MKKIACALLIIITILVLCSCSASRQTDVNTNIVDCYSIVVKEGSDTIMNLTYSETYTKVYEYRNKDGKSIYADSVSLTYWSYGNSIVEEYATIKIYPNKNSDDYIEYEYVGFIGWLKVENNYYFDIENRIIDSENKYSEYLDSSNPTSNNPSENENVDNKKAYQCAKKSYYRISGQYSIKQDYEGGLELHTYTKLGEDSRVTYKVKWF